MVISHTVGNRTYVNFAESETLEEIPFARTDMVYQEGKKVLKDERFFSNATSYHKKVIDLVNLVENVVNDEFSSYSREEQEDMSLAILRAFVNSEVQSTSEERLYAAVSLAKRTENYEGHTRPDISNVASDICSVSGVIKDLISYLFGFSKNTFYCKDVPHHGSEFMLRKQRDSMYANKVRPSILEVSMQLVLEEAKLEDKAYYQEITGNTYGDFDGDSCELRTGGGE